ncbi:hypothetical protein JNUCC1_00360 [Lentibacillus sp. JNUCC-1]|uniref:SCO family protein n=1 Tax=Lentibacillus sp. JNUCC-1 TaxID=2654513 RepID=UPI0012E90831|nr:SCO family protein [Lentibacillus sp. JNUCC-1]MUV36557.1 hypothetical protein [Lentibacillus sp. JNUCC-1]
MLKGKESKVALGLVLLFGFLLFFIGTDGFSAFTAETARKHNLIDSQPVFPEVTLEDSQERVYPFSEFAGKYVLITFIYTACTDVCPQLEMNMSEVYQALPEDVLGEDIVFLSVSFDPEQDTPETLSTYRGYFDSDGETWRMARINDQEELNSLLDAFGVIVIPDDNGNFTHNSAFYLVNPEGRLENVMDYKQPEAAAETIRTILEEKGGDV